MKNLVTVLLISCCLTVNSQVLPKRPVHVRVYAETGEIISRESKEFKCSFAVGSGYKNRNWNSSIPDERTEGGKGFSSYIDYGDYFSVKLESKQHKMIVHTQENIDSIPFMDGEFYLNSALAYLFDIKMEAGISISNFKLENFKKPDFIHPVFAIQSSEDAPRESKECNAVAEKLERKHGGKNWAKNCCNNQYQEMFIFEQEDKQFLIDSLQNTNGNELRTRIYPLNGIGLLKHDFFLDTVYRHVISYSPDGKSWQRIMTLNNEWYVNIIYFSDEEKIGIDISNRGIVLTSDYSLKKWKYYVHDLSGESVIAKTDAMVLRNENWYDSYTAKFHFSE